MALIALTVKLIDKAPFTQAYRLVNDPLLTLVAREKCVPHPVAKWLLDIVCCHYGKLVAKSYKTYKAIKTENLANGLAAS